MGKKYSRNAVAILASVLILAVQSAGAQKLINIAYPSPTTVVFRFDTPDAVDPSLFTSELSEDKTSITLDLQMVAFPDDMKNTSRSGKINGVYFNDKQSHLEIDIKLNDSYGYTCVPQPLSSCIAINIFKWNELNAGEDAYRAAQLAIESEIEEEAVSSLIEAIDHGHRPAKALLAYIKSSKDPAGSAESFATCEPSDTELPDVAFTASDMLSRHGYGKQAEKWMERYSYLTGQSLDSDSAPATHLEEVMASKDSDGIEDNEDNDTPPPAEEEGGGRSIEDLFLLIGISFFSIAMVTLGLVAVQRRRARKIRETASIAEEAMKEIETESFDDQLAAAKKKRLNDLNSSRNSTLLISEIAEKAQKDKLRNELNQKSANSRIDRTISDTPSLSKKEVEPVEIDQETGSANVHVQEKKTDIEDFLKTFIPMKKSSDKLARNDMATTIRSVIREVETANMESSTPHQTAELELALKIAQKESQNKFSKLRKLDLGKLEGNPRLEDLSRQLNIDTSALSAKKKVSDLQTSKGRISKLSKRFDVN